MEDTVLRTNQMAWQQARDYPEGAEVKVLREGKASQGRTVLLKLPPGWQMYAHSHRTLEQHYVLEGEYESEGRVFGPGSYQRITKGTDHGPFSTESGAVILVVWDPIGTQEGDPAGGEERP